MHKIIPALLLGLGVLVLNLTFVSPLPDTAELSIAADSPHLQITQTPVPTSASAPTGPPLPLTLTLLGLCCAFLILSGVVILGFVVRRENREVRKNE